MSHFLHPAAHKRRILEAWKTLNSLHSLIIYSKLSHFDIPSRLHVWNYSPEKCFGLFVFSHFWSLFWVYWWFLSYRSTTDILVNSGWFIGQEIPLCLHFSDVLAAWQVKLKKLGFELQHVVQIKKKKKHSLSHVRWVLEFWCEIQRTETTWQQQSEPWEQKRRSPKVTERWPLTQVSDGYTALYHIWQSQRKRGNSRAKLQSGDPLAVVVEVHLNRPSSWNKYVWWDQPGIHMF